MSSFVHSSSVATWVIHTRRVGGWGSAFRVFTWSHQDVSMAVSIVDYFLFMQWRLLSLDGVEIDKLRLLLPSWTTMGVLERGDFRFHYAHHNVAYSLDYFDSLSQNFEMPVFQHSSVFSRLEHLIKKNKSSLISDIQMDKFKAATDHHHPHQGLILTRKGSAYFTPLHSH